MNHDRRPHPARGASAFLGAGATALLLGVSSIAGSAAALVQQVTDDGMPGHLVLRSSPTPAEWAGLAAGDSVHWFIDASLEDADRSTLFLEIDASGGLVDAAGMTVSVSACPSDFLDIGPTAPASPTCAAGGRTVLATIPLSTAPVAAGGKIHRLADLEHGLPRHLMVTLGMAASANPEDYAGQTAHFAVGLHASGDDSTMPPRLAETGGAHHVAALALTAIGLLLLGAGIRIRRRDRTRARAEQS